MPDLCQLLQSGDTIAALSTPHGPSPRAILRLSGPRAETITTQLLTPSDKARLPPENYRAVSVTINLDGIILPARLYLMRAPRSYTREDIVEIHTFGAPVLLEALMRKLLSLGARPAAPGEFTRRAFLNGRIDLAQAEAVEAIVHAQGEAEYRAAHSALAGHLSRSIRSLRHRLADLAATVAVALDFSDQDVEIISYDQALSRLRPLRASIDQLLAGRDQGRIGSHGVRVVLYGPPNAGKSSLFNAILQRKQAIVSPHPGTTRDTLEATITTDGTEIVLVDTAGLHSPSDDTDAAAVGRSRTALQSADLDICVLDLSATPSANVRETLQTIRATRTLIVLNKRDLGNCRPELEALLPENVKSVTLSATTGSGIGKLLHWVAGRLHEGGVDRAPVQFMLNARQTRLLHRAGTAMDRILKNDGGQNTMDLVSDDIADALRALSEITGDAVVEDMLDRIFANFCIGK